MCQCLKIEYALAGTPVTTTIQINSIGTYNGANLYSWSINGTDYFLYYSGGALGNWGVTTGGYPFPTFPIVAEYKNFAGPCPPLDSMPAWITTYFDTFTTSECDPVPEVGPCECGIDVTLSADGIPPATVTAEVSGLFNNRLEFTFIYNNVRYYIQWNPATLTWEIVDRKGGVLIGELALDILCPIGTLDDWTGYNTFEFFTEASDCLECGLEDRHKKEFNVIRLPQGYEEEDRHFKDCCCEPYMVLASEENDTFKNDVTSAWIQVNDEADSQEFKLYKDDTLISTLTPNDFPNDNAKYVTIYWRDRLFKNGPGCYRLDIEYNIAGITGSITWGKYVLQPYTIKNALKTARVRSIFNGYHETEGLDFTGTNIEDTLRFYGYIGNRQTNTELDNLIYNNREMKRVIRENLNTYEIITDPSLECIIKPLIDLHLLSENELFISDYNAHNHSYRYRDIPVIVESSPKLEYYELSRKVSLTCEVSDKFKTNRTYYK